MGRLGERWREMRRSSRVARAKRRALDRELDDKRFEERQSRHEAGIYEPPHPGV
jgi:hypothetical protein